MNPFRPSRGALVYNLSKSMPLVVFPGLLCFYVACYAYLFFLAHKNNKQKAESATRNSPQIPHTA